MGQHRDLHAEERRGHGGPEEWLVPRIVRVGHQRDAGRQQLRSGGLDLDRPSVRPAEGKAVVGAGTLAVLKLGLAHCGAKVHVPEGRCLRLVDLAPGQLSQEGPLRGSLRAFADGGVLEAPVDAQPERAPQRLEDHLVLGGQTKAELDEVRP